MSGGGGLLFEEEEEHENHERYLITYADMITLLLALFIILFAIGQTDLAKFERLRIGLNKEFGGPALDGGTGILDGGSDVRDPELVRQGMEEAIPIGPIGNRVDPGEEQAFMRQLELLRDELGLTQKDYHVRLAPHGVAVVMDTDGLTFESGSWELQPGGSDILASLLGPLSRIDNGLRLEGHTDDRPMGPGITNWELSANRAGAVARYLLDNGIAANRLAIAGYADTRPVADNHSAEGRRANRRVEIVVVVD